MGALKFDRTEESGILINKSLDKSEDRGELGSGRRISGKESGTENGGKIGRSHFVEFGKRSDAM